MPSPPRHSCGAMAPRRAASSGCASPYEMGNTGILVMVGASLTCSRFASLVAPTPGAERRGRDELHDALLGRGEQHVERLDARVEPGTLELGEDPVGVVLVVGRADVMRARRQVAHVLAQ